jgi:hypothetical protein
VAQAQEALDRAIEARDEALAAFEELKAIQDEYQDWKDNLPDSLQSSATAEKLDAVCDLDLEPSGDDLDGLQEAISEADSAELPLGFGRD